MADFVVADTWAAQTGTWAQATGTWANVALTGADTGTGADALSIVKGRLNQATLADYGTGTDSLTLVRATPVLVQESDTGTGTDALSVRLDRRLTAGLAADTGTGTDALDRAQGLVRSLADPGTGTDALSRTVDASRALADTGTGTDAVLVVHGMNRALADTGTGADAASALAYLARFAAGADTAVTTDAVRLTWARVRTSADAGTGTDALTALRILRINYLTEPIGPIGPRVGSWTGTNATLGVAPTNDAVRLTLTSTDATDGAQRMTNRMPVSAGQQFTIRAETRTDDGLRLLTGYGFLDGAGAPVGSTVWGTATPVSAAWQTTPALALTVPTGAVTLLVQVGTAAVSVHPVWTTVDVRNVTVEPTAGVVRGVFTGDSPVNGSLVYQWEGSPQSSRSYETGAPNPIPVVLVDAGTGADALSAVRSGSSSTTNYIDGGGVAWWGPTFLRAGVIAHAGARIEMLASLSPDLTNPSRSGVATMPASRWCTRRVDALVPGRTYYVGFEIDGQLQNYLARAQTPPAPGTPTSFTAVIGDGQVTGSNHPVLTEMAADQPAFYVHQGDLHDADASTEATWRAAVVATLSSATQLAMAGTTAMTWIWDDHDWGGPNSWAGSAVSTFAPAAYRQLAGGELVATTGAVYRTWVWGRVRFVHTDLWSQRSNPADPDSTTKTLLGPEQKKWFKDTLAQATEPLIVWLCHWPTSRVAGGRWASYHTETTELATWLTAHPSVKARLLCVGGDSYDVKADSGTRPAALSYFAGVPSLNASPLDHPGSAPFDVAGWDLGYLDPADGRGVYGRIRVTDEGGPVTVRWDAVLDDGTVLASYQRVADGLSLLDGTPLDLLGVGVSGQTALTPVDLL